MLLSQVPLAAQPSRAKLSVGSTVSRFAPWPFGSLQLSHFFLAQVRNSEGFYSTIIGCRLRPWGRVFSLIMGKKEQERRAGREENCRRVLEPIQAAW